jgi:hypothetical protein
MRAISAVHRPTVHVMNRVYAYMSYFARGNVSTDLTCHYRNVVIVCRTEDASRVAVHLWSYIHEKKKI